MGAGLIRSGSTLHCTPRHGFGARVIPDASAPVIDPRTKPASLPARRNEFGVRHFSPRSRATPIERQPRCLVQPSLTSALFTRVVAGGAVWEILDFHAARKVRFIASALADGDRLSSPLDRFGLSLIDGRKLDVAPPG